jgi:two-component sensor histidine kinase
MQDSKSLYDATVCLSELVTNAIKHSRSRYAGFFTVQVARVTGVWRVSVGDEGGTWDMPAQHDHRQSHGRGLAVVTALASRWDIGGDGISGRVVWFEIDDHQVVDAAPARVD